MSAEVSPPRMFASIDPENEGGIYAEGTSVGLTATASTGYHFVNWTVDGTTTVTNNPTSITMDADHNVQANFELNNYTINVVANPTEGGSVNGGGPFSSRLLVWANPRPLCIPWSTFSS